MIGGEAMKKLQNDFTTPKQSKGLLELGVPEWSANCVLRHYNWAEDNLEESNWELPCIVYRADELDRFIDDEYDKVLPCWSIGRLIEIWEVITGEKWSHETEQSIIEELISNFNYYSYDNDDPLDFSKLED